MEWPQFAKKLMNRLDYLLPLPTSIMNIIVEYSSPVQWNITLLQVWNFPDSDCPRGMTSDGNYLYVCEQKTNSLLRYALNGKFTNWDVTDSEEKVIIPRAIDLFQHLLYVVDKTKLKIFSLEKKIIVTMGFTY